MTPAIYVSHDIANGYAHVHVRVGSLDMDERNPRFRYVDAAADYGREHCFGLTCQIGSGNDRSEREYPHQREPYAIRYTIDPRDYQDGVQLSRMPALAKAAARLERRLAKVAGAIGTPETFEDHAVALYLATKPERIVTRKAVDWQEADKHAPCSADAVRQAVRHALADIRAKLYPETVAA